MLHIRTLTLAFSFFCSCTLLSSVAHADPLLDQGLKKMATEIGQFLDEEGLPKHMIVGDFTGTPKLKASGGIEISRAIVEQLEAAGIKVSDDGPLQLMGKFKLKEAKQHLQDDFESLALEIEALILDSEDEELAELPISVFGSIALQLAGQTVDVPPKASEKQRQETLIHQVDHPPTKIDNVKTKPSPTSPFSMEIFVLKGNQMSPCKPELDSQSRSFVQLNKGDEYIVRLTNDASFEAAVTLTIDGVNMFVDAQDAPKDSRLIIYPGTHVDIPGWYFTKTHSKAFEIGGYEESVAKRVGNSTGVGMITAAFSASWDPKGPRPSDEPGGKSKSINKATKQGRDLDKNYVQLDREFGQIRSIITVRYDR
ncbi:hypothetical protein Pla52n_15750 [Stieleria varia]|uniref:DUF4384 domain-containing protein n=2 Tax=Stieleria varia TaxID=2528005 RepID=A0A5C6B1T6_9BACT|nr:hypothetical protein Pla52n_15750 [Stieleria varia]